MIPKVPWAKSPVSFGPAIWPAPYVARICTGPAGPVMETELIARSDGPRTVIDWPQRAEGFDGKGEGDSPVATATASTTPLHGYVTTPLGTAPDWPDRVPRSAVRV